MDGNFGLLAKYGALLGGIGLDAGKSGNLDFNYTHYCDRSFGNHGSNVCRVGSFCDSKSYAPRSSVGIQGLVAKKSDCNKLKYPLD